MNSYENKTVVITGATSGIGKASALAFAREQANVVVSGRRESEGQSVVAEIEAAGGKAIFVQTDVRSEDSIAALVHTAVDSFGRIDVAFNNAGTEGNGTPVAEESFENADFVYEVNVRGVLLSMKHEIQQFRAQGGGGVIINTASVLGHTTLPGAAVYNASKHAVIGLTKTAALEVAAEGIRILAISPAVIQTEMYDRFTGGDADAQQYMESLHPMGRIGESREIAEPVLFLASEAASFMTGSALAVDGGWLAK